jgi:LPXTG-motif cell wall-anchored protein
LADAPLTICDTGHNGHGLQYVAEQLEKQLAEKRTHYPAARLHIVLGVVNDKDVDTILRYMPQGASYYFTEPATSRALSANDLMARWRAIHPSDQEHVYSYAKAMDALSAAQENANEDDIIFELPVNNGAYTLTETQAPAGYLIIGDGTTTFTVTATGVTGAIPEMEMIDEAEVPTGVYIIKVQNSAGIVLPSTGGPGTNMIYLIGIMLTDIGGAGLVVRKRRRDAA